MLFSPVFACTEIRSVHTEPRSVEANSRPLALSPEVFTLFTPSFEGSLARRPHHGRKRFRSLPFSSAAFRLTDHCQLNIEAPHHLWISSEDPDRVGTVHSSAVLPSPAPASGRRVLLLSKLKAPINHAESTLLQVLILKQLKVPLESTLLKNRGGGGDYG